MAEHFGAGGELLKLYHHHHHHHGQNFIVLNLPEHGFWGFKWVFLGFTMVKGLMEKFGSAIICFPSSRAFIWCIICVCSSQKVREDNGYL